MYNHLYDCLFLLPLPSPSVFLSPTHTHTHQLTHPISFFFFILHPWNWTGVYRLTLKVQWSTLTLNVFFFFFYFPSNMLLFTCRWIFTLMTCWFLSMLSKQWTGFLLHDFLGQLEQSIKYYQQKLILCYFVFLTQTKCCAFFGVKHVIHDKVWFQEVLEWFYWIDLNISRPQDKRTHSPSVTPSF